MLYVVLNFIARGTPAADGSDGMAADATYTQLGEMTGLSRSLISHGLMRLQTLGLITATGSAQKRRYWIAGPHMPWFKLPCQAIVYQGAIAPFKTFTLRSKHELHALKLYLYLAACRGNVSEFSMVSYEKIHERTGISERDIRRAISLLISSGLLVSVDREFSQTLKVNEANKYFLNGYRALLKPAAGTGGMTATVAA
jgi:biotin operon repressor